MLILGKDHFIKFCITRWSMAKKNGWKVNNQFVSKITMRVMIIILIMSCVSCVLILSEVLCQFVRFFYENNWTIY